MLQQCLDGTDPGMPLAPASDHPPIFFSVAAFRISQSAVQDHQDHISFLELNSLLPIAMSSQIGQNYSTEVVAAGSHLHCGPCTPTSLWASIWTATLWLWRVWATSFANWPRRSARTLEHFLKMPSLLSGRAFFLEVQKLSQDEWGKTQDTIEAALLLEKNLEQAILDLYGLGSVTSPHICDFWRTTS